MNVIQGIWRDLVDKRLWPIALGLLVLIVAVPVVLARTGGATVEESPSAVIAGAESTQGPREAVVVEADPGETPTPGAMRNPFYDAPDPEDQAGAAGSATGSAVASAGKAGASADEEAKPSGGGGNTGSTTTPGDGGSGGDSSGGTTKKTSKGSGESGYDVSLRFGTDAEMKSFKAVPRLTPLPSADTPSFVYLGVLSGGKTAVFMIAVDVTAVGDGTCRPSATLCETLELEEGETEFLDVTGEDGQVTQYQLDVTDIKKIGKGGNTLSAEEAGRAKDDAGSGDAEASAVKAGERAVRRARKTRARKTLDRYRFVRSKGVVVRRASRASKRARASSTGGLRVRRTGHVVAGGL